MPAVAVVVADVGQFGSDGHFIGSGQVRSIVVAGIAAQAASQVAAHSGTVGKRTG
jgi:hypothetical protein